MAAVAALFAVAVPALATTGKVSAENQAYSSPGAGDPYNNSPDLHVGGYGGQPGVTGYVRLNFDSLPPGSELDGARLSLTPNGSATDNVNSAAAAFEACVLTSPLTTDGYQSNPPPYDCATHAVAEPQSDGTWAIELGPLLPRWKLSNTGLALVAYSPPNGTPLTITPSAWSVGFDHTKTAATVDYSPGRSGSFAAPAPAIVAEPLPPPSAGAPAIPALLPAPAAASGPVAAPPAPAAAPQQGSLLPAAPVVVNHPRTDKPWLWVTAALAGAIVLLVLVGAGQQVMRSGRFEPAAALTAARSQFATPIAVMGLAGMLALGSSTQLVAEVRSGAGGLARGGASGTGTSAGQAATGSTSAPGSTAAGGTGGAGGGGSAAGPAAASALIGGASGSDPRNGPGVTNATVRIGFTYTVNAQSANSAFGLKTPDTGNQQSEEQAMVDYVNKHGGIAGRQIQPVYVAYDNAKAESDPTINEEICHQMTEDYHVFAVIGGGGPPDDLAANACYAQAGTMSFDLEQSEPDLSFLRQASPYVWLGSAAALDRVMRMEVAGLQHQGYFSASKKYGVVVASDYVNDAVYKNVTLPGLHAAGASSVERFDVPHDTVSDIANTMKRAVVQFQANQVTNVMFQGGGNYGTGSYATLFMLSAESQHYNPRYGLNSDDGPTGEAGQIPEDQLQGALAVGIAGVYDTDDAHYAPWPSLPNEKKCADIESAAGNSFASRLNAGVALLLCGAVFEFQQGAAPLAGQPLNAQLWADQAMRLGNGVFNAIDYRPFVGPAHWDMAGGYRLLHAVQNCEGSNACFVYDDSNIYS